MAIYGIDLGTTYSSLGYIDEYGKPVVVRNDEGMDTTPSVVFFETESNVVVGKRAKNASRLYPDSVVSFIKRDMGKPEVYCEHFGRSYRPEDVSALILKKLIVDAKAALGETAEIKEVVITCPAYFGIAERSATKLAGELAGLKVVEILNEPTAAALFYSSLHPDALQSVLVYDLGGGTFDVTVIKLGADIEVKYTGGDHQLGGKDWDQRIIDHLVLQIRKALPDAADPESNVDTMQSLFNQAEEIKKDLTAKEKTVVAVWHEGRTVKVEIAREQFDQMTGSLLEQTIEFTRTAIEESRKLGIAGLDKILLVGGSSRMLAVEARLRKEFGIPTQMFEPDLAVVKGAALRAQELDSRGQNNTPPPPSITDVCSHSLGITVQVTDTPTYAVRHLIHAQQALPVESTERDFQTIQDSQTEIRIQVMEQAGTTESTEVDDNKRVAEGLIKGIPLGLPKGSPIHVTFRLERDGTLTVRAVEPSSGKNVTIELKIQGAASRNDIQMKRLDGLAVA